MRCPHSYRVATNIFACQRFSMAFHCGPSTWVDSHRFGVAATATVWGNRSGSYFCHSCWWNLSWLSKFYMEISVWLQTPRKLLGFHGTEERFQSSRKDFTLRLPIGRRKHEMIIILTNPTSDIWILRLTWQTCWRDFVKTAILAWFCWYQTWLYTGVLPVLLIFYQPMSEDW